MFDDSSLKIKLYIYAPIFFGIGAYFGYKGWFWAGALTWIVAGVITAHVLIISVIRERSSYLAIEANLYEEKRKFYEQIQKLTAEEKYILGLSYIPTEVTVKKTKTEDEGNEFSQTWKSLPVAPYKLKVIAQAVLNGEGFTYRKWAGDGKILTDPEWRKLHDAMTSLGMLEPVNEDDPRQGFNWTPFGSDVMRQVVKDTI